MKTIRADRDELNFEHSPKVEEALKKMGLEDVRRYGTEEEIIKALAEKHRIEPERIFLESGTIGVIHRIFDSILNEKANIVLPKPSYPYYYDIASHHNARIHSYPVKEGKNKFSHDTNALLANVTRDTKAVVIIDPEAPTGASLSEKELKKILDKIPKSTLVFLDQAHEGFRDKHVKDIEPLIRKYDNLLIARSFSKLYGLAGKRIAYAVCGDKVKNMVKFKGRYLGVDVSNTPLVLATLKSEEHYKKIAGKIREEKELFNKEINSIPGYKGYETDTGSALVKIPESHISVLEHHAEKAGIKIRNLVRYDEELKGFIRITMSPEKDNERVLEVFRNVGWLHHIPIVNTEAKRTVNTREAGYTVHRLEFKCPHSKIINSWYKVLMPPGSKVPGHKHTEQDEFFHFLDSGSIIIDGKEHKFGPDIFVQIKPGQNHEIRAPKEKFLKYFCSRFPYKHRDKYTSGKRVVHKEDG